MSSEFSLSCPFPIQNYPQVLMAHGGGGKLMHQLIGKMFLPAFRNSLSESQHDASVFEVGGQRLAFTTDSFVVRPLFFPGGDLGSLAVHGRDWQSAPTLVPTRCTRSRRSSSAS